MSLLGRTMPCHLSGDLDESYAFLTRSEGSRCGLNTSSFIAKACPEARRNTPQDENQMLTPGSDIYLSSDQRLNYFEFNDIISQLLFGLAPYLKAHINDRIRQVVVTGGPISFPEKVQIVFLMYQVRDLSDE